MRKCIGDNAISGKLEIQVEDEDGKREGIQHSLEAEIKWFVEDTTGGPLELGLTRRSLLATLPA